MTKRHNPIRLNWSLVELIWFCCSIASVMLMLAIDDVYDPGWWRVLYVPGVVLLAVVMPLAVGYAPSVTRWQWFCVKAWVLRRLGDKSATVDRLYEDRRARLRAKERAEIDRILNTPTPRETARRLVTANRAQSARERAANRKLWPLPWLAVIAVLTIGAGLGAYEAYLADREQLVVLLVCVAALVLLKELRPMERMHRND